ncbi:MAG: hypothetical protein A2Z11_01610, partial [Candidatus Woykebacteria bacterium RBG_16_43_9]
MQLLGQVGGVIDGSHVVYTSRKHGRGYINWVRVLNDNRAALATAIAMRDLVDGLEFDTVVGPTHTGDKVASNLSLVAAIVGREMWAVYAQEAEGEATILFQGEERQVKARSFPRGQTDFVAGCRVLVVDDVLTTGGTILETIVAVEQIGC